MSLQEGQNLGPYRVINQLGQGGMATVYKAYHARLDRFVALKIMHKAFQDDPTFQARFEREAQIVARLEHPNIVPVYDYNDHEGQPFLVMKHVDGRTLKNILSAGPLPLNEILRIMDAVANALTYAHRAGVLHRDIKPSNIIIGQDGQVYLTDFGLARIAQAGESTMSRDMMLGTPQYISPEQASGDQNLDARTDVYSFGIILYEMLVGRVPFNADTPYATVHDHIYTPLPMPSLINPELPPAVEAVVVKTLEKQPADRYDTALDVMVSLRHAAEESGLRSLNPHRDDVASVAFTQQPAAPRKPLPTPPSGFVAIPTPKGSSAKNRSVERSFDASNIDFNEIGRRLEHAVKKAPEWAGEIATSVQKSIRENQTPLSAEERIRRRVEKRFQERRGLMTHMFFYVVINAMLWGIYFATQSYDFLGVIQPEIGLSPDELIAVGEAMSLPWPFFTTFFWGIGIISHMITYYSKYGPGADRREEAIQREIDRERERSLAYSGDFKEKREARMRLTDDGEIEEVSDDYQSAAKNKRR